MTKAEEYRDVLETWVKWWDGPGHENYRHFVVPPLTATREALACTLCAGVDVNETPPNRCQACGREIRRLVLISRSIYD